MMATVTTVSPMAVKPAPVPIAPLSSNYRRVSSSNSSRKRSYAESMGAGDSKGILARGGLNTITSTIDPGCKGHPGLQPPKPSPSQNQVTGSRQPSTYHYIGSTTQFEPLLFKESFLEQDNEVRLTSVQVQRVDGHGTYAQVSTALDHVPLNFCISSAESEQYFRLDRESLGLYFSHVNSVLPLLKEADTWHLFNTGTLPPSLLISINLISQRWKESKVEGSARPATSAIDEVAMRQFNCSLAQPLLSTIQAGLLLIQFSTRTPYLMSTQLTTIGYELGLHQDCSQWKISQPERNLRKRLGWMLYAQDKWFSLLHGRPSYVSSANWTIPPLSEQDFEDGGHVSIQPPAPGAASVSSAVFMMQFTTLTQILSEILDTFHTLGAQADVQAAGSQGLRVVLERAKPVQIKLKNWFSRLPDGLKMDASGNDTVFAHGSLHLAYFAAEITLHRCIIRATAQPDTDPYLSYICRSAAKTRLISAMDLVNRLRPVHLQSFWPFAGFSHFALIGTFGALLEATAPTKEEAEFYHMRLEEYRWTLMVSRVHADFLGFAIDSLDTNLELLHNLPEKPGSAELKPIHAMPGLVISGPTMLDPGPGQDLVDIQRDPATRNFSGLVSPATSSTTSSSSSSNNSSSSNSSTGGPGPYLESNQSS